MALVQRVSTIFLFLFFLIPFGTASETATAKGDRLAREFHQANKGFKAEKGEMKLTLIDAYGQEAIRELTGLVLEVEGDGDRSLSIFKSPLDVKGTKLLTHSHKTGDDDQWLYLPSVKRVKRISSANKSGSFMGSEFSYEDLGGQETEKYNHKWLRSEKLKEGVVEVLERVAKDKSGYSKQVVWIVLKTNSPSKIEYYDRRGELLKVANFEGYKEHEIEGKRVFRPMMIKMENVQTKKKSIFSWSSRTLGVKLDPSEFEQRSLK